eukprot:COSAG06_NODE_53905_length_297_cov_1.035354_2_plen_37_part_01
MFHLFWQPGEDYLLFLSCITHVGGTDSFANVHVNDTV